MNNYLNVLEYLILFFNEKVFELGIGDWGLGIGDWGLGIGPNPQSPIPNPHSKTFSLKNKIKYSKTFK